MLPNPLFHLLCLPVFAIHLYSTSSYAFDSDALQREQNKSLQLFSLEPYEQEVQAMNAYHPEDDWDEPSLTEEQHRQLRQQTLEDHRQSEDAKTPEQRAAEERRRRESDEKERRMTQEIEDKILTKILAFCKTNPTDENALVTISNTQQFRYWADFCDALGDYFWKQKRHDDADYFYDLANLGVGIYTQNSVPSSQGRMHLGQYNQELATTHPTRPTPSMFHNLQQTIQAFHYAIDCMDEVAEFCLPDLKQLMKHMSRWHLSNPYVATNPILTRIAYAYDFVDRVLSQAASLAHLRYAKRYDGSLAGADLAKRLIDQGFFGIWQNQYEHNWVRPDGLMVRVKSKPIIGKPGKYAAEFTIGITARNPLIWDASGQPVRLAYYAQNERNILGNYPENSVIAFDEDNEMFKLAYEGKTVWVVPSRKVARRWRESAFCGEMMKRAHFSLAGGFGDARNHFNTKKVESLLSF